MKQELALWGCKRGEREVHSAPSKVFLLQHSCRFAPVGFGAVIRCSRNAASFFKQRVLPGGIWPSKAAIVL